MPSRRRPVRQRRGGAAAEYADLLRDALAVLARNQDVARRAHEVFRVCNENAVRLSSERRDRALFDGFAIEIQLPLEDDRICRGSDEAKLLLRFRTRALPRGGFDQSCTLAIAIKKGTDPAQPGDSCCFSRQDLKDQYVIARHFHFDLDSGLPSRDWPQTHIQYGGRSDRAEPHYCLHPHLETPRIPYPPFDFILVLDMALTQFRTVLNGFNQEPGWKQVVQRAESFWLREYFRFASEALRSESRARTLYEELCAHAISFG